ncbi:MAG: LysM peptidoglycan-binding domain-containing protein [Calditrichaeota bacterium]|nr:MAG: LysM peptidoglycan-binding domain-containing protein [Calditrichota bacterium]
MPAPAKMTRAEISEVTFDQNGKAQDVDKGVKIKVQFNPETLRLRYSNQSSGGNQPGRSAIQHVTPGTTNLSLDLWFDVTGELPEDESSDINDVRKITSKLTYFMKQKSEGSGEEQSWIPPGLRFLWGTFIFEGVMDSLDETLEYFSEEGRPLRAKVSISLSKQEIDPKFGEAARAEQGDLATPGTQKKEAAKQGDSMQSIAGKMGKPDRWKELAALNKIENPRQITIGTLLDRL